MDDYVDFEKKFNKLIEYHKDDKDYHLIKDYPAIFSVVKNIAVDRNADGCIKMLMNSAISYFIYTEDILSEKEFGIKGYMDDFFICIYALRQLLEYDREHGAFLIKKYWAISEDYEHFLSSKYYALDQKLGGGVVSSVLSSSGMGFAVETANLKNNPRKYLELKTRDLQRKIQYLLFNFFSNNMAAIGKEERRKIESQIFGTEEFMDFIRNIERLSKSDDKFLQCKKNIDEILDIEEEIKKARAKRLLK